MQETIFSDLKVVELASVLAGPAIGMFFRELGATVVKIENKTTGGDVTRNWRLPSENTDQQSAYYSSINWKKETLLLNLKEESDYELALRQIAEADILISNFKKESAQKLKLDFPTLSGKFPNLIYAELSGFEPGNSRPAFDVVLQAESGFLYMCGNPNQPPVKMPVALIDILAAHQLKEGILIALLERAKTGKGTHVTASLYESAIASLANQATNWLMAETIPQPMGTQHPNIAPYGDMFQTKDKNWIVLAVGNEKQFQMLCAQLDLIPLPKQVRDKSSGNAQFDTNQKRVINRAGLNQHLAKAIEKLTLSELSKKFLDHDIPFGHLKNMKEVFENPAAQEMILEEVLPDGQLTKRVKTVAFRVGED